MAALALWRPPRRPFRGRPEVFERLLEILNDFADWLGLRAHTLLSELSPSPSSLLATISDIITQRLLFD